VKHITCNKDLMASWQIGQKNDAQSSGLSYFNQKLAPEAV